VFFLFLSWHWVLGGPLVIVYGYILYSCLADFKKRPLSFREGLVAAGWAICLGLAVFATLSYMLVHAGFAVYSGSAKSSYWRLLWYYVWLLLDLLPVVEATKSLKLEPPLQPEGVVAGLPIVIFKGFVVFVMLRILKEWWQARSTASPATDDA